MSGTLDALIGYQARQGSLACFSSNSGYKLSTGCCPTLGWPWPQLLCFEGRYRLGGIRFGYVQCGCCGWSRKCIYREKWNQFSRFMSPSPSEILPQEVSGIKLSRRSEVTKEPICKTEVELDVRSSSIRAHEVSFLVPLSVNVLSDAKVKIPIANWIMDCIKLCYGAQ